MPQIRYTQDLLRSFANENNIKILYDKINFVLYSTSKIPLICPQCENETTKVFSYMLKTKKPFCKNCITINSLPLQKLTMLKKYGVEHPSQSLEIKQKTKEGFLLKWGTENPSKTNVVKEKAKKTNMKRYGVEYMMHVPEFKQKMIETNIEKYGVPNALLNETIKEKVKNTNIERYGFDVATKNKDIMQRTHNTLKQKYGVEHSMQLDFVKEKSKQTCIKRYGVENPSQNSEIAEKQLNSRFNTKQYIFPSGKIVKYQGYENFALNDLLKNNVNENDIVNSRKEVPEIFYKDEHNKLRRHYVDIFIPSQNLCIEVKSEYTITLNSEKIYAKQNAAIELGYKYEIWCYNKFGVRV